MYATTDKMILGENAVFSMDTELTGLNNNVIICGSSGCGKTLSVTEPHLLETNNTSLIVTVTKRRIVDKYKPLFLSRGYTVMDLNFVDPEESDVAFDPLQYVKTQSDISFLAEAIVKANPLKREHTNADPFWDEAARSLLAAEISYTMMENKNATFSDVLELHESLMLMKDGNGIQTSLDEKFEDLAGKDPFCFAMTCWKSFRYLPINTASCVYSTLNVTIDTIFNKGLRKMISKGRQIDFQRLAEEKSILFVSTSPVNTGLHTFVNLFYSQAFKSLFEYAEKCKNGQLPIPVHVLCDDFCTGSKIMNFPELISVFREKRLSVSLLIQSESQLQSIYGEGDATTIINNCDSYVYLGGMDRRTGYHISERLDVPLTDVLYMPIGQVYIFRRGQQPIKTSRYSIFKDKRFVEITKRYEDQQKSGSIEKEK